MATRALFSLSLSLPERRYAPPLHWDIPPPILETTLPNGEGSCAPCGPTPTGTITIATVVVVVVDQWWICIGGGEVSGARWAEEGRSECVSVSLCVSVCHGSVLQQERRSRPLREGVH